jgi:predicted ATPase
VAELERVAHYRLLDTMRAFALEKLAESGEREGVQRRHAEYYRHLFEQAEVESETDEWLADYGRQIDNMRAALDWAFSPDGDVSIGVALAAAAVPVWMHLSLLEECRARAAQALATLEEGASRDPRREMKLHAALIDSLMYTKGAAGAEIGAAWTRVLEIAESLEDTEYQLRSLWGLWCSHTADGRHRQALALAQRSGTLAADRPDPNDRLIADRMIGVSQHYLGDQVSARRHLERVIADYVTSDHRSHITRFQIDVRVAARAFLARILWLQGFPDQAARVAESSVADALATGHTNSFGYALAVGVCPIALLVGDLATAEHYPGMLFDLAARHGLTHWRAFGACFQGAISIGRGDVVTGLRLMRAGYDEVGHSRPSVRFVVLLMTEALGQAGQVSEGLVELNEALERSEKTEEGWLLAELLRIKGELLLMQEAQGAAAAAEDHFRKALDWARRQGLLSWELRAAMSLARLLRAQDRSREASALLEPVYDRFTEGFDTEDFKAAKTLLDAFR